MGIYSHFYIYFFTLHYNNWETDGDQPSHLHPKSKQNNKREQNFYLKVSLGVEFIERSMQLEILKEA
jgi:hypothetical protein